MASGDHPNTSRKPSSKKAKKFNQKEQSERFKETALKIGVDESGKDFDKAVKKVLRPKQTTN